MADTREKALQDYRKKLLEHKEVDGRLKECKKGVTFVWCDIHLNLVYYLRPNELISLASGQLASAVSCR